MPPLTDVALAAILASLAALAASVGTMIITIANMVYQGWRQTQANALVLDQRQRDSTERLELARIQKADAATIAAALAQQLADHRAALAEKVAIEANAATARMVEKSDELREQIAGVGVAAANAYDVGNHSAEKLEKVNAHLENLNLRLIESGAPPRADGEERRKA